MEERMKRHTMQEQVESRMSEVAVSEKGQAERGRR